MARLVHPNVVAVHEVGVVAGVVEDGRIRGLERERGWRRRLGRSRPKPAGWLPSETGVQTAEHEMRGCEIPGPCPEPVAILSRFGLSRSKSSNSASYGRLRTQTHRITNVDGDGGIPEQAAPNWATYNNFRSGDLSTRWEQRRRLFQAADERARLVERVPSRHAL